MNYLQILESMKEIALSGVNEVYIGDVWNIDNTAKKYPLLAIDPNLKTHTYINGIGKFRFDLYFVDLVYQDKSNELLVQNDMITIALDYFTYIVNSDFDYYIKFREGELISFTTFTEKWNDYVAGCKLEITVEAPLEKCESIFGADFSLGNPLILSIQTTPISGEEKNTAIIGLYSSESSKVLIDWGDSTKEFYTLSTSNPPKHIYENDGTYEVKIYGESLYIKQNVYDIAQQILSVDQWGDIKYTTFYHSFKWCNNLTIGATDKPDMSLFIDDDVSDEWGFTNFSETFTACIKLTNFGFNNWNFPPAVKAFKGTFISCYLYNEAVPVNSNIEILFKTYETDTPGTGFDGNGSEDWDLSNIKIFKEVFGGTNFNVSVSRWSMNNCVDFNQLFFYTPFDQPGLRNWITGTPRNTDSYRNMLKNTNISTANYNVFLEQWSQVNNYPNMYLGVVGQDSNRTKYSAAFEHYRDDLINNGWTIYDGGCEDC